MRFLILMKKIRISSFILPANLFQKDCNTLFAGRKINVPGQWQLVYPLLQSCWLRQENIHYGNKVHLEHQIHRRNPFVSLPTLQVAIYNIQTFALFWVGKITNRAALDSRAIKFSHVLSNFLNINIRGSSASLMASRIFGNATSNNSFANLICLFM